MQIRDVLGVIYDDASFRALFAVGGRPAEGPWRLALVTVMQFAEGLPIARRRRPCGRGSSGSMRLDWS
jgi:hypothetical protein